MDIRNIAALPPVANVCQQILREVERQGEFSLARVTMNPLAESLLHNHRRTTELYIVTKGYGELGLGTEESLGSFRAITAGNVCEISTGLPHMLRNKSAGQLEHLVIATPPFDPADVYLLEGGRLTEVNKLPLLQQPEDCFDGARIIPYTFPNLGLSVAFGFVTSEPERRKRSHYHEVTTEFVYVVEGKGIIMGDGQIRLISEGDWVCIEPGEEHSFVNERPEALVLVCISSPLFSMSDVHYRQ